MTFPALYVGEGRAPAGEHRIVSTSDHLVLV